MSSKEPTLSPEAADIKAKANDAFKRGDYQKAHELYSSAIEKVATSPALFSNRSAAAVKLRRFTEALQDAETAVKLDPEWEKAWSRKGNAQEWLRQYTTAYDSYKTAEQKATQDRLKSEYSQSAARVGAEIKKLSDAIQTQNLRVAAEDQKFPFVRLERLRAQGHAYGPDSAAYRNAYVTTHVIENWTICQKLRIMDRNMDGTPLQPGHSLVAGPPNAWSGILGLPAALLDDPFNSFAYVAHEVWTQPMQLAQAMMRVYQVAPRSPSIALLENPNALVNYLENLRAEQGWNDIALGQPGARSFLAGAIRLPLLFAMMTELMIGDHPSALTFYEKADAILVAARAKWADQADPGRAGTTLRRTFRRAIQSRMLNCIGREAQKNGFSRAALIRIETLAQELIKSCEEHPIPKPESSAPGSDFIYWIGYDAYIRAEAYLMLALVHRAKASKNERQAGRLMYLDEKEARLALENYLLAASWVPEDDRQFATSLFYALEMQMRIGGVTLQGIDEMIATAKKCEEDYQRFHGPDDHDNNPSRKFVLENRDKLAKQAALGNLTDPSKIILDAIPRFVTTGSSADLPPLLRAAYNGETVHDEGAPPPDPEGRGTLITIVEVFTDAKRRRRDEVDRVPEAFVDD